MAHRSPSRFDLDMVELAEASSISGSNDARRMPFRLRSRFRRRKAVIDSTSSESVRDCGVRGGDGLRGTRVCNPVRRRRFANGG